jgi:hypothetical protein
MGEVITGDIRPGAEFRFTNKPSNKAASTFAALVDDKLVVTRRAEELFTLPDSTPVLAHWHGERRTDGFSMTVSLLEKKANEWQSNRL